MPHFPDSARKLFLNFSIFQHTKSLIILKSHQVLVLDLIVISPSNSLVSQCILLLYKWQEEARWYLLYFAWKSLWLNNQGQSLHFFFSCNCRRQLCEAFCHCTASTSLSPVSSNLFLASFRALTNSVFKSLLLTVYWSQFRFSLSCASKVFQAPRPCSCLLWQDPTSTYPNPS